ncbi:MAG: hypothetical protein ACREKR_04065 [Candidatus Methylomirabilales bacterium]
MKVQGVVVMLSSAVVFREMPVMREKLFPEMWVVDEMGATPIAPFPSQ